MPETSALPEWIKILIAVGIGGLITGGLSLLTDYLRHRRRKKECFQDILAPQIIEACKDIRKLLKREVGFFDAEKWKKTRRKGHDFGVEMYNEEKNSSDLDQ